VETQLTSDVKAGASSLPVQSTAGFAAGDGIWIEHTGTNEEQTTVAGVGGSSLTASVTQDHFGTLKVLASGSPSFSNRELAVISLRANGRNRQKRGQRAHGGPVDFTCSPPAR
jgi:hypothetical protein